MSTSIRRAPCPTWRPRTGRGATTARPSASARLIRSWIPPRRCCPSATTSPPRAATTERSSPRATFVSGGPRSRLGSEQRERLVVQRPVRADVGAAGGGGAAGERGHPAAGLLDEQADRGVVPQL